MAEGRQSTETRDRWRQLGWRQKLAVFVVLVVVMVRVGWALLWRRLARRITRPIVRRWRRTAVPHPELASDGWPTDAFLRAWVGEHLGRAVPDVIPRSVLVGMWRNRAHDGIVFYHERDSTYRIVAPALHDPPRTPFEVESLGGYFLFLTNRGAGCSYLQAQLTEQEIQSIQAEGFGRGYTGLWQLEQLRAYKPPSGTDHRAWDTLRNEEARSHAGAPSQHGDFLVLRDLQLSKWPRPHTWQAIVHRTTSESDAHAVAAQFTERWNVSTCVARIVTQMDWH